MSSHSRTAVTKEIESFKQLDEEHSSSDSNSGWSRCQRILDAEKKKLKVKDTGKRKKTRVDGDESDDSLASDASTSKIPYNKGHSHGKVSKEEKTKKIESFEQLDEEHSSSDSDSGWSRCQRILDAEKTIKSKVKDTRKKKKTWVDGDESDDSLASDASTGKIPYNKGHSHGKVSKKEKTQSKSSSKNSHNEEQEIGNSIRKKS